MSVALRLEDVVAGYGPTVVIERVSFAVETGRTLALLGRNGVGKTTLLETVMGLTTLHGGRIEIAGKAVEGLLPFERQRRGLALVPQQREIFPSLTVDENLRVSQRPGGWSLDDVYTLFPGLQRRRGNDGDRLSGGEQQMLALGRALCGKPDLLLLDEPMEGLAPVVVDAIADALTTIRKAGGLTIVLAEPKVELAYALADEIIVLDRGQIVLQTTPAEISEAEIERRIFGAVPG